MQAELIVTRERKEAKERLFSRSLSFIGYSIKKKGGICCSCLSFETIAYNFPLGIDAQLADSLRGVFRPFVVDVTAER